MIHGGDFTSHMSVNHESESHNDSTDTNSNSNNTGHGTDKNSDKGKNQSSASSASSAFLSLIPLQETLARLSSVSKPEHRWLILAALALAFNSLVQLSTPYLSGRIIDVALQSSSEQERSSSSSLATLLTGLFAVVAFAAYLTYLRTLWQARAGHRVAARLRRHLYAAILSQDTTFFDAYSTGDLLSRLTSDVDLIQTAIQDVSIGALRSIFMALGAAAMLVRTSWSLAAVALTILPPIMMASKTIGRHLRDRHATVRQRHADAASTAHHALTGVSTVHQFVTEAHEANRYGAMVHQAHWEGLSTANTQAQFRAIVQVLGNGSMLCVLGYGGQQVARGDLSAGALAGFVMYSLIMAGNLSALSNTYMELAKYAAATNRLLEILDRTPKIDAAPVIKFNAANETLDAREYEPSRSTKANGSFPVSTPTTQPMSVDFRNVSFSYRSRPGKEVLRQINLSIQRGEVLALVGTSGSGKSTCAALLTRLYDPLDGNIYMDGTNIRDMDSSEVRRRVGVVAQDPILFPISIAENIRYGRLEATDAEVEQAARLAHVWDFCQTFPDGMHTMVGARGTQLSGGQKQRVAVARVILKDPPIVILDEATSALDAESEHKVQEAIDSAMKGRTVIAIAHRLSTIQTCDRVAVLADGHVAEVGKFDDLVAKSDGAFRTLMKRQLLAE